MDKMKIEISPHPVTGEVYDSEELFYAMVEAGWSDDPGTGHAVLLPDGRELCNPMPMAPPIGFKAEPSLLEMIQRQILANKIMLDGDMEVETDEEANDFDMDDEWDPRSQYEIVEMNEDVVHAPPGVKLPVDVEQAPVEPAPVESSEKGA